MSVAPSPPDHARLYERYDRYLAVLPYVLLGLSLVLSQVVDDPAPQRRWQAVALSVVAAIWVFVTFTLPRRRGTASANRMTLYFAGLVVLWLFMMPIHGVFFVFVITGFFHAHLLERGVVTLAGVTVTSLIVNQGIVSGPDPTGTDITVYVVVVLVQAGAIGGGMVVAQRVEYMDRERLRTMRELEAALAENAGLHRQLLTQAREAGALDERQRMAREIHDTVAQGLTGIIAQLQAADNLADDPQARRRHLDTAAELARSSLTEARRSVQAIGPPVLEETRLPEAVRDVATRWSNVTNTAVVVTVTGDDRPMHPEIEVTLLRTVQEGLANVGKHARAGRVGITLTYMEDVVTLDIRDDGVGFTPGAAPREDGGYGLTAMRQRITRLAGELSVESEPGAGTAISANLPAIPQVTTP
ncbi:signal transduction histidine kinase [Stackebrandtia albiflava]|uniref:Oxygen sensor histidine kinase NreB n=1 Tax=Stackebrandtia albiflava TaxID=406432 RepID=A0A562V9T9_9ACTN|nr:sensor histidine kinase [Stackebrandtia albiflava]TWJ14625.1 signal transduction histidine kinase [Stackebrandtia albiflava]